MPQVDVVALLADGFIFYHSIFIMKDFIWYLIAIFGFSWIIHDLELFDSIYKSISCSIVVSGFFGLLVDIKKELIKLNNKQL